MNEWRDDIQPLLRRIRTAAGDVRRAASSSHRRPTWETLAEDEMCRAETELMMALSDIRVALTNYRAAEAVE
jgi:hypothetical protein